MYRRIMPSAERLSSKFHSCPRSLASLSGVTPYCYANLYDFTTASPNGVWVPQASRSFSFWQPAAKLETAPNVSKSWQPSHEPSWETNITELINMKSIERLSQSFDQSCRAQPIRCQCLVGSFISRKTAVINNNQLWGSTNQIGLILITLATRLT